MPSISSDKPAHGITGTIRICGKTEYWCLLKYILLFFPLWLQSLWSPWSISCLTQLLDACLWPHSSLLSLLTCWHTVMAPCPCLFLCSTLAHVTTLGYLTLSVSLPEPKQDLQEGALLCTLFVLCLTVRCLLYLEIGLFHLIFFQGSFVWFLW